MNESKLDNEFEGKKRSRKNKIKQGNQKKREKS